MQTFDLRQSGAHLQLSGEPLSEPLIYPAGDPEAPIRLVGYLSQLNGSVLRIFNAAGDLVEVQRREATTVMPSAVGGLAGPR